jgi:hypothetical protein
MAISGFESMHFRFVTQYFNQPRYRVPLYISQIHSLLTSMLATKPKVKDGLIDFRPELFILNWNHNISDLKRWTPVCKEQSLLIRC